MSATNYLEAKVADHVVGTTTYTKPTSVYVKLHLGDPGEDATANPAANTTRKVVTFGAASNPGGVATSNSAATWTSVSNTETYSHFSIWDDISAGNPLLKGALTASVAVTAGDDFSIPSGNLTVTLS